MRLSASLDTRDGSLDGILKVLRGKPLLRVLMQPGQSSRRPRSTQGMDGGESGIRTHGTVLPYTRFPSVRLKPLGHLSGMNVLPARAAFFKGAMQALGADAAPDAVPRNAGFGCRQNGLI